MTSPVFYTQQSEQYRSFLREIIELINRAETPVEQAAKILGRPREDLLADTREKLRKGLFSIVLIGAFQSGKSTLFNYLCDGRELSPVGPGGGGIRTSGCRVSAHPQVEGGREFAEVTWRTKGELLRSLGSALRVHYDIKDRESANASYLTERLVNLDDREQRDELAEHAWNELNDTGEDFSYSSKTELMRFALLVCAFYPDFAERINKRTEEWKVDDAVIISSYPQDWESRWERVKSQEQVKTEFRPQDVAFAFCGGLDFYLDSANLRILGCSISDCPGLFISEWDTEIAKTCIRGADAVLYMFEGAKALTQSDLEALQACVTLGGKHKLIFGANLKIASRQWKRVETEAVAPVLRANGFENPEIHAFHAGLALRAYEAILHQYGSLSEPSRRAIFIELDGLKRERTDKNITWYLHKKQLKHFIERLTDDEQELEDFCNKEGAIIPNGALDELSAVPKFVRSASDFVTRYKFESVLLSQGCRQVARALKETANNLTTYLNSITGDIEDKKSKLNEKEKQLQDLKIKQESSCSVLGNIIEDNLNTLLTDYSKKLDLIYEEKSVPKIKSLFTELKPFRLITKLLVNKRRLAQDFQDRLIEICINAFTELRDEINATLPISPEFVNIWNGFMRAQSDVIDISSQMRDFSSVTMIQIHLSERDFEIAIDSLLPNKEIFMEELIKDPNAFWKTIWGLLTLGFSSLFTNKKKKADRFLQKYDTLFRSAYKKALTSALNANGAPFQIIRENYHEFKDSCNDYLTQSRKRIDIAKEALRKANSPEVRNNLRYLKETLEQVRKILENTLLLEKKISDIIATQSPRF